MFQPVPHFDSLKEEERYLLGKCEIDMQHKQYKDDDEAHFISELFEEDKARLMPLASVPFDTSLYTPACAR